MAGNFKYALIGSGMQGTAEGYDLARFGDAERVIMCDLKGDIAAQAAGRINDLTGTDIAESLEIDVKDTGSLISLLKQVDTCCGAAHYALNLDLTRACIEAGCHFNDMGGNTGVVHNQHHLHQQAVNAGVSVTPDCGLAPGLGNTLAARSFDKMEVEDIQIRCGGLPQTPKPPLDYSIVFSVAGLTNEYTGMCVEIRDGTIVEVPAFTELESIEFDAPVGKCEAFLTSGGTSTGPWSFQGKLNNYGYKTVRYPGHFEKIRTMIDMGFLDLNPVLVGNNEVIPRDVFHVLAESRLNDPDGHDLVVLRVVSRGRDSEGQPITMVQNMVDYHEEKTGFTAMERTTAYSASIVAIMMTRGELKPGVHPLELSVNGDTFVNELARREIHVKTEFFNH